MNKQTITILASVSLALLAVVMHAPALWAAPPLSQVILESDSWPAPSGFWEGPAIIWIDGIKYSGTVYVAAEGEMTKNSWHGTEVKVYDFGALGILEVSGSARTVFAYISPEHRWHRYTSNVRITDGTGAFATARGTFKFVGYTDWDLTGAQPPHAFEGTRSKIVGIQ